MEIALYAGVVLAIALVALMVLLTIVSMVRGTRLGTPPPANRSGRFGLVGSGASFFVLALYLADGRTLQAFLAGVVAVGLLVVSIPMVVRPRER